MDGGFADMYANLGFSADELRLVAALRRVDSTGNGHGLTTASALRHLAAALGNNVEQDLAAAAANLNMNATTTAPTARVPFTSDNDGYSPSSPVDISLVGLLLSVLPVIIIGALSGYLRLGLHRKLAVGVMRCALQLSCLGYILVPIFVANRWWITLLYAAVMCLVAAAEAVSRPAQAYHGMLPQILVAMGVACAATITFGLAAVVGVSPWYDSQYLIPMLGMLLGNSCSSVAVGLSAVLDDLSSGKEKVEALLALGASRVEATREVVTRAARLALTPLLNSLNVVGIVSIPGMMTGQILGGSDPAVAARYQIMIFYLVTTSTGLSAVATIYAAVLTVCDEGHRLRADKLHPRAGGRGVGAWIAGQLAETWGAVQVKSTRAAARVRASMRDGRSARSRHRYFSFRSPEEGVPLGVESAARRSASLAGSGGAVREPLLPPLDEEAASA